MQDQPLVSIIIPTYNRAHLIGETLDSVLAQTYQNWECIVVDDGSTDGTDALMAEYVAMDSRFHYHHRPDSHLPGGNGARNYGFELSTGEFVQWFDSDDFMLSKHIQKKCEAFKKSEQAIDFAYCGLSNFSQKTIRNINRINNDNDLLKGFLDKKILLNVPTFMYDKKSIANIRFDENLTRAQDLDFCFRFLTQSNRVGVHINKVLVYIREHNNSITSDYNKNRKVDIISELKVRKQFLKYSFHHYNNKYIDIALKQYLLALGKAMKTKYFKIYFSDTCFLWRIKPFLLMKIVLIGISYKVFGIGEYRYKRIYQSL